MKENQFDVIVFGTGLVESITAAALAKAGYKIAHIDTNAYYGGDEASLSLEEIVTWVDQHSGPSDLSSRFYRASRSAQPPSQSRQYSICLQPAVLPSVGPLINALVASGVSKYSGFRLVDCVSVYEPSGRVSSVPGSKEDIFKNKEIGLIEKRRLMRFLTFAAGDFETAKELEGKQEVPFVEFLRTTFSLGETISSVLAYALAFSSSSTETTLPVLHRLRGYLRSSGRYGPSPFLIGHYGCLGDISQGFCRAAAVSGGVYILGREIKSISKAPTRPLVSTPDDNGISELKTDQPFNYHVELADFPDTLECSLLISSPGFLPNVIQSEALRIPQVRSQDSSKLIARCIAIIDTPISLRSPSDSNTQDESQSLEVQPTDTGILVFPPSSMQGGSTTHSATVLLVGEGSMSTPKGKSLVYIGLPLGEEPETSPEDVLKPYLDVVLSLSVNSSIPSIQPLFTAHYFEKPPSFLSPERSSSSQATCLIPPPLQFAPLPDFADVATEHAERTYGKAVEYLRIIRTLEGDEEEEVAFWPPLPIDPNDEDDEW
ncbi:GDP dissociation inhibitor-domain-containing protein [Crepidotus variabilis]|uniref:GDP dissociation inhibitor-domain-containing protein n=1 Tax=Crepidotus variabilis TaxID=179855 RepID=A0A9P6ES31_9AGAR|nr:GDP dissociation inhibitor-domain-containing protein [Crepidotus variabilis]